MDGYNLQEVLSGIDPSALNYQDWVNVGMALKAENLDIKIWDDWSRNDARRYHPGECERKWTTFEGAGIGGGTLVTIAKEHGWRPPVAEGYALGWDDDVEVSDAHRVIQSGWLEPAEVTEPTSWHPGKELSTYLDALFEAGDTVGYVTEVWKKDEKFLPTRGVFHRTAGELIQDITKHGDDLGAVVGDYNPQAGAWIRFNPLDGQGCKNANVAEFRYALVESDTMPVEQQNAIIRELELPVAVLVHSGSKSLHAIVKVDAADYPEYRKRVEYLYAVLAKNGMEVDTQNKNPSRLSRMPGIMRNGKKQYIVDKNIGKKNWNEWHEWIEGINDDLPDAEHLADIWDNLPELSPPLIEGVLRQGHKMLLAGPSKAGKSYALIELCIALAEGREWLGFPCACGRVLYVNLELDRASCLHRFKDVYTALGWPPKKLCNLDVWNLRGKSVPMDKLAPKLIRRAEKKGYIAIVIDPIYKVITGDENSADQMAAFCNQFDKVCTELDCAVIYCHHHSKGSQGNKKSMDRASGSGVFARDPDAMLDLIELELTEDNKAHRRQRSAATAYKEAMQKAFPDTWRDEVSLDDELSERAMEEICYNAMRRSDFDRAKERANQAKELSDTVTAWRIDGTLREFAKFPPVNVWFEYPAHIVDKNAQLEDISTGDEPQKWKKNLAKKKSRKEREADRKADTMSAYEACKIGDIVTVSDIADYLDVSEKTVRNRLREHGGFWIKNAEVGVKG